MRRLAPLLALLALVACNREKGPQLAERINTADEAFASQLLSGFYPVEEKSWRWSKPGFAVALKPPRQSNKGAILVMQYSLPEAALAQLKETTISPSIDGIPLQPEKCSMTGLLELRREIPADALAGKSSVKVEFQINPFLPASDQDKRDLGLIVHNIGLIKK